MKELKKENKELKERLNSSQKTIDEAEKILENNKLIAEFMGRKLHTDGISWFDGNFKVSKYKDWNSLMPVVEKIDTLGYDTVISRISINISKILDRDNPIISIVCGNISKKKEIVHKAVVEFIKWYNENK